MDAALIRLVWQRANGCCEYCQIPQAADDATFEIDHIVSRKHRGPTVASNLCLSCYPCNSFKGTDLSSLEGKQMALYNPRRQKWLTHFRWEGAVLVGRTPTGRATVQLLRINDPFRVDLREELNAEGLFKAVVR